MAQDGKLKLQLVDVYGKRLQENVDISLRSLQTSDSPTFKKQDASKLISISNLFTAPQGTYQLTINPRSYNPVGTFVNIKTGGPTEVTIPFAVDIAKIVSVAFPTFPNVLKGMRTVLTNSANVLGFENKTGKRFTKLSMTSGAAVYSTSRARPLQQGLIMARRS